METWFYFALMSAVTSGLYSFLSKVSAQFKHHPSLVTMYSMISASVCAAVYLLFTRHTWEAVALVALLALINIVSYTASSMTRIDALKHIDSTIYFPIYKVGSSLLAVPIGLLVFADSISVKEGIGMLLGLLAPLLLISRTEHHRQQDLRKGLILTFVGMIAILVGISMAKTVRFYDLDMSLYLFLSFVFGIGYTRIWYAKTKHREHATKHVVWMGLMSGVLLFTNFFLFTHALSGDLGTVYVINSFSTVIPVILSVIFFKEHFNIQKAVALGLTLTALVFLS